MVCRRVWLEYGSRALNHIGTVLGPTSGAKGGVPLSTREPRRGPECQMWALFRPNPLTASRNSMSHRCGGCMHRDRTPKAVKPGKAPPTRRLAPLLYISNLPSNNITRRRKKSSLCFHALFTLSSREGCSGEGFTREGCGGSRSSQLLPACSTCRAQ